MNKPVAVVTTILITLTILAGLAAALRVTWIIDTCELQHVGKSCRLTATLSPQSLFLSWP